MPEAVGNTVGRDGPFVRRNWKRIAAAACAAAVAGAFLLPGKGAKPAGADTEYLESAVERRNITNVFSGSGTIAAANTYTVNALVSMRLKSTKYHTERQKT